MNIEVKVIKKIKSIEKKKEDLEIVLYFYKQLNIVEVSNLKEIVLSGKRMKEIMEEIKKDDKYEVINDISFEENEINIIDKLIICTPDGYKHILIVNGVISIEEGNSDLHELTKREI